MGETERDFRQSSDGICEEYILTGWGVGYASPPQIFPPRRFRHLPLNFLVGEANDRPHLLRIKSGEMKSCIWHELLLRRARGSNTTWCPEYAIS